MAAPALALRPFPGTLRLGRVTCFVRNTTGVEFGIRARDARQRAAVRAVTARGMDRVLTRAQDLCPRDTGYMALHMRAELTRNGFNFVIGWHAADFIGKTNEATGEVIKAFYPAFVLFGTRFMQGRDPITPALRAERPNLLRGYRNALSLRAA